MDSRLVGKKVGAYRILTSIAAGGMGEVYRARDLRLERDVAIKALPKEVADNARAVERLRHEARMLAALNHPNIATIYGLEELDCVPYLVMELVLGQTLAERIAAERLEIEEALQIAVQLSEALAAAHRKGITHRDVKPANVKVTPEGLVKVLDFGLAKAVGEQTEDGPDDVQSMITSCVLIGTPAYMSPERLRGEPSGQTTDVWAFGCVLYELLTGRRAFDTSNVAETCAYVLTSEPDWGVLPFETPGVVRLLLARCLEKRAHHRLQEMGEARGILDSVVECRRFEPPQAIWIEGVEAGAHASPTC
ncbi:MAG TPA: serine/threonine-protein kinase [Gemmatimonadales bacterium]|nr:serine/threonine-protein kinase [Gemmatimonadales bacterium]